MIKFVQEVIRRIQDDDVPALGAQLTFYLILSFFPFLIFLLTLVSYTPLAREEILHDLFQFLPSQTYQLILDITNETVKNRSQTLLSFGMIGTIWASSRGVMAIIKGINKAYDEEETRSYVKVRGLAILYTLILAIVILLTFILLVFGKKLGQWAFMQISLPHWFESIWKPAQILIPLFTMYVVFMLIYKYAPSRRLAFGEVIPGALFATAGWIISSLLFASYIDHFGSFSRTYGSIGGIIVLLIWMYVSNIIIILGGEINATLAFLREGRRRRQEKQFGYDWPFFHSGRKK